MLEQSSETQVSGPVLTSGDLAGLVDQLRNVDRNAPDPELIDQITELERIKSACAAAQAALTLAFVTSQTEGLTQTQQREARAHRSIGAQVAHARHDSPARGGRHVGAAKALLREMPHTYRSLQTGEISEYRATLIIRETACLDVDHRRMVDKELAGTLGTMGDRQTANTAAKIAYRLDPESCVERNRKALEDRRVSIRPAPDTMTYLSALLSVAHGVAVYAALNKHATNAKATGDSRSHAQLMADELVHRITNPAAAAANAARKAAYTTTFGPAPQPASTPTSGTGGGNGGTGSGSKSPDPRNLQPTDNSAAGNNPAKQSEEVEQVDSERVTTPDARDPETGHGDTEADDTEADDTTDNGETEADDDDLGDPAGIPPGINLDIQLVMTDRTLFDGDNEPAILIGHGPIPAPIARQLVRTANAKVKAWIRRLYTDPQSGQLINGDGKRRDFSYATRQFIVARDHTCRTAYCDAPIRHTDHVTSHAAGGPSIIVNGRGTCAACNYTKEAPGWRATTEPDGTTITVTTPTGHTISTQPPAPPQSPPWEAQPPTIIEIITAPARPVAIGVTKAEWADWWEQSPHLRTVGSSS